MPTLREAIAAWELHLMAAHTPDRTLESYIRDDLAGLEAFARAEASTVLEDVRACDLQFLRAWLHWLSGRRAPSSRARAVACVRSWQRFLRRRGLLTSVPADELAMPKVRHKLPSVLSVDEARRVVESASERNPRGLRDRAVLELLYGSALRLTELRTVDIDAIDLRGGNVRVHGKGSRDRDVPLGRACIDAIRRWLVARAALARDYEFRDPNALFVSAGPQGGTGRRISERLVENIVRHYGELAGVRNIGPHSLRHACATHMLEGGADLRAIQDLLGHASLKTTQIYCHVSTEHLLRAYERSHPLALRPRRALCDRTRPKPGLHKATVREAASPGSPPRRRQR